MSRPMPGTVDHTRSIVSVKWHDAFGAFYRRVAAMDLPAAWGIISALRDGELHLAAGELEGTAQEIAAVMRSFPLLADGRADDLSRAAARRRAFHPAEVSYLVALHRAGRLSESLSDERPLTILRSLRAERGGIIVAPFHVGPYELVSALLAEMVGPVSVVSVAPGNSGWDVSIPAVLGLGTGAAQPWLSDKRVQVILASGNALVDAVAALKSGRMVCIAPDVVQADRGRTVPCQFYGRQIQAAVGAVALSAMSGAPLLPLIITPVHDGYTTVRVGPPITPQRRESRADTMADLMQRVIDFLPDSLGATGAANWLNWRHVGLDSPKTLESQQA